MVEKRLDAKLSGICGFQLFPVFKWSVFRFPLYRTSLVKVWLDADWCKFQMSSEYQTKICLPTLFQTKWANKKNNVLFSDESQFQVYGIRIVTVHPFSKQRNFLLSVSADHRCVPIIQLTKVTSIRISPQ